jgi:hypothetical protein
MAIDKKYIMDTIDGFIKRTDDEDKRRSIVQLYNSLQGKNSRDEVINELYKNLNRKSDFSETIDKHRNFFSSGKTTTRSLFDGLFQEIEHEIGSEGNFLLKTSVESNKRGITENRAEIDLNKGDIAVNRTGIAANTVSIQRLIERIEILEKNNKELKQVVQNTEGLNIIVAHNMLAIVRLEIATITDQIINIALTMKREVTGSERAAVAINIAATLAVLACNALAPGVAGMIGGLLLKAGEVGEILYDTIQSNGQSLEEDSGVNSLNKVHPKYVKKSEQDQSLMETLSGTGKTVIVNMVADAGGVARPDPEKRVNPAFDLARRQTLFITHGSGGTYAITYDVQKAVTQAFTEVCERLQNDTRTTAAFNASPLVQKIKDSVLNPKGLHPLTNEVLLLALANLKANGGTEYWSISQSQNSNGKTKKAQERVKRTYEELHKTLESTWQLPGIDEIKLQVDGKGV